MPSPFPPPRAHAEVGATSTGALEILESQAIFVLREIASECRRPALMFSGGKDSAVLLHLAVKAFRPGTIPFPLLHVDTGQNFPEVLQFRDRRAQETGCALVVESVEEGLQRGWLGDSNHLSSRNQLQAPALLHAVGAHAFDALFGGARRDEDKARAKERIISHRTREGRWDPENQRPELWDLYHAELRPGEHLRVFPLSDWTELDVWRYIEQEGIELPPLYFSHERDVLVRDDMLMAVSEWVRPGVGERSQRLSVRFRTVGDASCTGAIRSRATTVAEVIREISASRISERGATRADDRFSDSAMEDRKRQGYF
ncbi:MAG: sulfate adenylyltransferase subunit CysD [Candidatus Dormibacteria bacterium]